jgi:hypothetical protein
MYVSGYLGQTPAPGTAPAPAIDWTALIAARVGVFRVEARKRGFILDAKATGTIDRTAYAAIKAIGGTNMVQAAVGNVQASSEENRLGAQKSAIDAATNMLVTGTKEQIAWWKNRQYALLYPNAMRPAVAGAAAGVGLAAVIAGLILL